MHQAIYTAIKDFVQATLNSMLAHDVPDTELFIEIADTQSGAEWTGIKIHKTPSAARMNGYISGAYDMAYNIAFESKQAVTAYPEAYINYASYLEGLADELTRRFKAREFPALPQGVTLKQFEPISNATLHYADLEYGGYIADMRFIFNIYF